MPAPRFVLPRALLLALLVLTVSCVRQGGPERPVVVGGGAVVVLFSQAPEELPFNPRGARLLAATQQLEDLVEHPVAIQLDAALLPQWAQNFENGLAGAIENVARDLAWMKQVRPRIFAFGAPSLRRIECHYDATARFYTPTFDDRTGTLTISGPVTPAATSSVQQGGPAVALIEEGAVRIAIPEAYVTDYLERLFARVEPESAPLGDLDRYWDYLDRAQSGYLRYNRDAVRPSNGDDSRAVTLHRVVRFAPRVPPQNAALTAAVREALVAGADFFGRAYMVFSQVPRQTLSTASWRDADAAWAGWLDRNIDTFSEDEQRTFARSALFVRRDETGSPPLSSSIDVLGIALHVVDRWIAAGHTASREGLAHQPLFQHLVCPLGRGENGRPTTPSGCSNGVYTHAAATSSGRARLIKAISARKDAAFTETVFINLRGDGAQERANLFEVWRGLEGDALDWPTATRTIAESAMTGSAGRNELYDEGLRLWRSRPEYRGETLYLLAGLEPYNLIRSGLVDWPQFDRIFGSPIDAAAYTAYLRQGPLAISNVAGLWPALGPGFSRIAPLLPLLDAYIQDRLIKQYNFNSPEQPLKDIASRLCADHAEADLALLNGYFRKRASERPSEERRFGLLLDITSPGRCVAAAKPGGLRAVHTPDHQ